MRGSVAFYHHKLNVRPEIVNDINYAGSVSLLVFILNILMWTPLWPKMVPIEF